MSQKRKILILGANSQIARSLIDILAKDSTLQLFLFTHRPKLLQECLSSLPALTAELVIHADYQLLHQLECELMINCIGAGSPGKMQNNHNLWYDITERYDCLALTALQRGSPQALYVNFSSGAVYGRGRTRPCRAGEEVSFPVNHLPMTEFYSLMRLNAEARDRTQHNTRIVDLRIFSFFSRFSSCEDRYFLSDVLAALLRREKLLVSPVDTVRDYIHPNDLLQLIELCAKQPTINTAVDVYSREACRKFTILEELKLNYGLQYEVVQEEKNSLNGTCDVYYSENHQAAELGYQPQFTSLQTIISEIKYFLERHSGLYNCAGHS